MLKEKDVVFIKIGGSVITDKTKPHVLNEKDLHKIAKKIKALYDRTKKWRLFALGHGSGSFGHYEASLYQKKHTVLSASKIKHSASELHQIVFSELVENGIPVFSFSPASFILSNNGKVEDINLSFLDTVFKNGFIPLIYGDVIMDKNKMIHIFSTERVLELMILWLQKINYRVRKVIMISQETGVYDKNGDLIKILSKQNIKRLSFYDNQGFDVTGGMKLKAEQLVKLADRGIESVIINTENFCSPEFSLNSESSKIKFTTVKPV